MPPGPKQRQVPRRLEKRSLGESFCEHMPSALSYRAWQCIPIRFEQHCALEHTARKNPGRPEFATNRPKDSKLNFGCWRRGSESNRRTRICRRCTRQSRQGVTSLCQVAIPNLTHSCTSSLQYEIYPSEIQRRIPIATAPLGPGSPPPADVVPRGSAPRRVPPRSCRGQRIPSDRAI